MALWRWLLGIERTEKDLLRDVEKKGKRVYAAYKRFDRFCRRILKKVKKKDRAIAAQFKLFLDGVESSVKPILRAEARFLAAGMGDVYKEKKRDLTKTEKEIKLLERLIDKAPYGKQIIKRGMKIVAAAEDLAGVEKLELKHMNR